MNDNNNKNKLIIEPMYETDEGLEFIPNPENADFIRIQAELGTFKMAFRIHSVDGAEIYAIFNNDQWTNHYDLYRYICLKRNPKEELYNLLIEGKFDIGIARLGSYHVIKEIKPYSHEDNDEIRMHYEEARSVPGNIAYRSIHPGSDVFQEIVNDMNNRK
jgi:hypothetical protein